MFYLHISDKRTITLYAGYKVGFISGAERCPRLTARRGTIMGEMVHQTILKWLNSVIPNLPPKTLLVMDNAAYHNTQSDGQTSSEDQKEDRYERVALFFLSRNNSLFD